MNRTPLETIEAIKNHLRKGMNNENCTVEEIRVQNEKMAENIAVQGFGTEKAIIAGMKAEWVRADGIGSKTRQVVLYLHGGGFISGSCNTHRELAARISIAAGVPILVIEFRLAPEYKYPSANDDCLAAYEWLLNNGYSPEDIILGGESTGGYLVLQTMLSLRNSGKPLPRAAFLLSPHTDFLYYDGESYITRAELDPMSTVNSSKKCAEYYFDSDVDNPAVLSPLNEDLSGLPDMFIQVGDHEVILDDSARLAEYAEKAGVNVTLEVWENMWHIFRFMAYMLPEGQEAIENIGGFIKKYLG